MSDDEEKPGEGGEGVVEQYPYGEYVGARDDDLNRHGYGSALLPNNDIYEGNYRHGKRHGKGMYCFRNGARYDGEWRIGTKHGFGQLLYPDGTRYIGQWRKDFKHGNGIYYYINGDTYEGAWFRGWKHGLGTYTYVKDNVSHYGIWKNGRMEGAGILTYPCGYRYHGPFYKNLPKGRGMFTFEDRLIQYGFYINMRDPAFDYVGAEEMTVNKEGGSKDNKAEEEEDRSNPPGIVPIWRARHTVKYKQELVLPVPFALPIKDSEDSLLDIIDYLQRQYGRDFAVADEDEGNYIRKPTTSPAASPVEE